MNLTEKFGTGWKSGINFKELLLELSRKKNEVTICMNIENDVDNYINTSSHDIVETNCQDDDMIHVGQLTLSGAILQENARWDTGKTNYVFKVDYKNLKLEIKFSR